MKDIIETEAEYETALERIEVLMGAEPGSPEADELMQLAEMVENYEDIHYPMGLPPEFKNNG